MVKRVKAKGVPFDLLACDALYGRDRQFRADLAADHVQYAAQVPADTLVYLSEPQVGMPPKRGTRGRPHTRLQVLSGERPHEVRALAQHPQIAWQRVQVRLTERGWLTADFAVQRVWTVAAGQRPRAEWLVGGVLNVEIHRWVKPTRHCFNVDKMLWLSRHLHF